MATSLFLMFTAGGHSYRSVQKLTLAAADSLLLKGKINYMCKQGEEHLPQKQHIKVMIYPVQRTANDMAHSSLLWIFLTAFGGGLLALLTPCVYSMIPLTVTFFTKRSKTKAEGIRNALYYACSTVLIFTLLGSLMTLIFGPNKKQKSP